MVRTSSRSDDAANYKDQCGEFDMSRQQSAVCGGSNVAVKCTSECEKCTRVDKLCTSECENTLKALL